VHFNLHTPPYLLLPWVDSLEQKAKKAPTKAKVAYTNNTPAWILLHYLLGSFGASRRVGRVHLERLEVESAHPSSILDRCGFLVLPDTTEVVILCNPPSIHLLRIHTVLWMQVLDLTCGCETCMQRLERHPQPKQMRSTAAMRFLYVHNVPLGYTR